MADTRRTDTRLLRIKLDRVSRADLLYSVAKEEEIPCTEVVSNFNPITLFLVEKNNIRVFTCYTLFTTRYETISLCRLNAMVYKINNEFN